MPIHSTAIVDPSARIPESCNIGPYCIIGPNVELGEDCQLVSHVHIEGPTRIGKNVGVFPFTSLGMAPQDIGYAGEPTRSRSVTTTKSANSSPSIEAPSKAEASPAWAVTSWSWPTRTSRTTAKSEIT